MPKETHHYIDFEDLSIFTDEFNDIIIKCMDWLGLSKENSIVSGCAWNTPHFVRTIEDLDGLSLIEVSESFVVGAGFPASFSGIKVFNTYNPFKSENPNNTTISFFFKDKQL